LASTLYLLKKTSHYEEANFVYRVPFPYFFPFFDQCINRKQFKACLQIQGTKDAV